MEDAVIEHIDGVPVIRVWGTRTSRPPGREKRPIWSNDEITKMLRIIKDKNILSLLYGGKYRKSDVFKVVAANLRKMGYIRTAEQISTKWKHLRLTYAHAKAELKSGNFNATQECAYYTQMDDLLGDKLHFVGVDIPEDNIESYQKVENIEIQNSENVEPVIVEAEMEFSETEYSQIDFSQVEVIQTDASETDVSLPGPSGHKETVVIEVQEPYQDQQIDFSQSIDSENTVVETSPPVKKMRKRKMFRNPPGRLRKSNEGTYSNALKSFTKEWESMMMRVAEKEREQDRLEKDREKEEQQRWEERLIEQQSEAMTKANSEFLIGLKGLFEKLKK